jgi:hypothetical protein
MKGKWLGYISSLLAGFVGFDVQPLSLRELVGVVFGSTLKPGHGDPSRLAVWAQSGRCTERARLRSLVFGRLPDLGTFTVLYGFQEPVVKIVPATHLQNADSYHCLTHRLCRR